MWGPWFMITFGGLLLVLLLVGIAFGTAALLIPVLIVAAILGVLAVFYVLGSASRSQPGEPAPDPVRDAAPQAGEGAPPPIGG